MLAGTHFHEALDLGAIQPEDGVTFAHMDVRLNLEAEDVEEQVTFLFKLLPGRESTSLGIMCAAINHIDKDIIERARDLVYLMQKYKGTEVEEYGFDPEHIRKIVEREEIARRFLEMDLDTPSRPLIGDSIRDRLDKVLAPVDFEALVSPSPPPVGSTTEAVEQETVNRLRLSL